MRSITTRLTLSFLALLALAVVTARCGGGSSYSPMAPTPPPSGGGGPAADVTITINGMNGNLSYSPNPATMKLGQTVAWRNADGTTHTATADGGTFDTGNIAPGATSNPITMTAAGSYPYHCRIHGFTMVGTLNVTQ